MMAIKIYIQLALVVILSSGAFAQGTIAVVKGQKIPEINFGHVLNSKTQKITTSDLSGKLVILDFWNTYCSTCIHGFPTMNALQKKFGDKVKILLITDDKEAAVNALFKRIHPDINYLTVITDDTLLKKMFPHYGEPHHVWISQEGVYQFATFDHNATEKNINAFLAKGNLKLTPKQDGIYKEDEPLLSQSVEKFPNSITAYSILVKGLYPYTVGGGIAFHLDSISGYPDSFRGIGLSPLSLLKAAFNKEVYGYEPGLFGKTSKMRLILDVKDTAKLFIPIDPNQIDAWQAENFWSYEVKVQPENQDALYKKMQQDLMDAFNYTASIERREMKYIAIVKTTDGNGLRTKGINGTSFSREYLDFKNIPFSFLMMHLNDRNRISKLPIVDETGIDYKIDLKISTACYGNLAELKRELNSNGLDIVYKTGKIQMLVIKDKKSMAP